MALAAAIDKGALANCQYVYVQHNAFDGDGKAALQLAALPKGIKLHFGMPPTPHRALGPEPEPSVDSSISQ
jgi:hypothetical protein